MNKIAQYACFGITGLLGCTAYAVDTVIARGIYETTRFQFYHNTVGAITPPP